MTWHIDDDMIYDVYHHPLLYAFNFPKWVIAMVPSSLTFDNSPKRRCSLWIHDVPYLYPIALQGYPTHFIVMYMYRPHHLGEAIIYQSEVISNEDICCGRVLLNDAPPTNLSDQYRVEIKYTNTSILDERIRTVRSMHCCKLFILYIFIFDVIVI